MSGNPNDDQLALRVYRLVREYVNRRTEDKCGLRFDTFKADTDESGRVRYPPKYLEAREKVCSDAFLAMRGRRDKDLVEYFAGTICSVPQWLPEEEFVGISQVLIAETDKVKTLAMLALSACSWSPKSAESKPAEGAQS